MTRREFLEAAIALTAAPAVGGASPREVPRRKLGRTGESVSILGVGGAHLAGLTDAEAVHIVRGAVDGGITFLDNCWDYGQGESERKMGLALRDGWRDRVFLMTKIDGRDAATARRQIDESLRRLGTDRLDLLQFHEVIRASDPARIFAAGGAIEAMREARQAGKVRFLGFTGHKDPSIHLAMLEAGEAHRFRPDTVQMPLNVMDAHFDSFEKRVLPVLLERGIAALGMKPMGSPYILESRTVGAEDCLRYAMSLPVSVVITGIDSQDVLAQDLRLARGFEPLREAAVKRILARTRVAARRGAFERYKTTAVFDATSEHPEWLGPA